MFGPEPSSQEDLPYRIVLWRSGSEIERVLGRAVSPELAQAIFRAAQNEYPQRRITLDKGDHTLSDSLG
ncbi:MAG TPA: hypothetical protein VKY24_16985 [Reyranella sp.]|nr:hypothetical protein [Reyranella sp.]